MRSTARWLATATLAAAALTAGAGSAHADPPKGWQPGTEYDYGRIIFTQHGWFKDRPGNYHTGDIEVEEDDDGVTGFLADWRCTEDAVPPQPYSNDPVDPRCKLKQAVGLQELDGTLNLGTFDQKNNRLGVHLDVPTLDYNTGEVDGGTVRIDLTIVGLGAPTIYKNTTATTLEYEEYFFNGVKAWGQVDGKWLGKTNTVIHSGSIGFWLDGYTRTP